VLVDDIISTGRTMIAAARHALAQGLPAPVCIGVHAVLAGDACEALLAAGAARVVTTNTIPQATGVIDVSAAIAAAAAGLLAG
jgi:ribose-phosphate pyrophosphokinase